MPIVFNTTGKNTEQTPLEHDPHSTPITRSRRTLSTGSLHRLKKEVGASLQQHQNQDDHDWQHQRDFSGNDRHPSSNPSSPSPLPSCLVDSERQEPNSSHRDHQHRNSHNRQLYSNKETNTRLLVATRRRNNSASRNLLEEQDNDNTHPYLLKQRACDRGTPSPSPSLSPPPSSPTSSVESSESHSDKSFALLSPPASATTALPPPSILSNSTALYSPVSSPEGMESEESIPSLSEKQNQLEDISVARRTNTARSSYPPLAPSSLWVNSSERRGNESERESQTKRRRSMDSPEQSPSPAENDGQIKGVMCPLSPSSSQASPALDVSVSSSNSCSPLPDKEQRIDADDDDDVVVGLETVFEAREPSSETKASTHGSNIPAAETISGGESLECTNTPFQSDYSQRPAISYAGLIIQVLLESTKTKMTLADIYSAIMQKHPYYRHAASGWQNSVRNSLSLNKAFAKVDRTPDEPGHGCFWALQSHVRESSDPLPCRKRKAQQSDIPVTARSKGASLPKLDCVADSPSERSISSSTPSFPDSAPSPAASEDAEDLKSPRRSGRARRPPRPKEAEEYIGLHTRQSSQPSVPLSTPPSSPSPYGQDREVTPVTTPARKRASSVKIERIQIATTMIHPSTPRDEAPLSANSVSAPAAARKVTQDVDLASIPGVVTTPRIRRPPQNLAEFVSSEDFKAAPYGKRQERTLQSSSSSSSLNGAQSDASLRERKEAKRSKSESHISFCNSGMRANRLEMDQQHAELEQQDESLDRSPSIPNLAAASRFSHLNPSARPATIPLSALSHSKRGSQDSSCLNSKKQRRDASSRSKALYNKRHSSHEVPTRQQILDRRRQDGKREIMVASEDDWSDSDFDFLRDEEENYRLMRIRVRKIQRTCGRWSLRNEVDDGYVDVTGDDDYNSEEEHSHTEEEKIKLLMDPSVINYGFDSCDGEYILDYHQGPLFNNVTWPEFSDVKGDSGNSSSNPGNSSSSTNSSNVDTIGKGTDAVDSIADIHVLESVIEEGILVPDLAIEQADIDSQIVAEVLSAMTKSVILGSESIHPTERIPAIQTAVSALPPVMSSTCIDEKDRKEEADEWTLFVGNCDPKMECNTGASCRNMDVESETKLNIVSSLEHILPESEIAAVVAAVNAGAITETIPAQMEGIVVQTVPVAVRVKEEIEAEDFIGWSLCE